MIFFLDFRINIYNHKVGFSKKKTQTNWDSESSNFEIGESMFSKLPIDFQKLIGTIPRESRQGT